jgi:hypothetical protein
MGAQQRAPTFLHPSFQFNPQCAFWQRATGNLQRFFISYRLKRSAPRGRRPLLKSRLGVTLLKRSDHFSGLQRVTNNE